MTQFHRPKIRTEAQKPALHKSSVLLSPLLFKYETVGVHEGMTHKGFEERLSNPKQ